ncbi:MAG: hypothetical protein WBA13_01330 [Microcoleaceae cyanobacterium]
MNKSESPAIYSMIAGATENVKVENAANGSKGISYSFHNSIKPDRSVKKTAIDELWDWVNEEDFTVCPICNAPFKYPGLDAAKCDLHGWVESRKTKLEALCQKPLRLTGKKKAIKPSDLTEEMARTALFILRGVAV